MWKRFLFLMFLSLPLALSAQEQFPEEKKAELVRAVIELQNGETYLVTVLEETETMLRVETEDGIEMNIPKERIVSRENITTESGRMVYPYKDPNATRLFFTSTGRTLKRGQGYFSDYEIFFPMLAFGVTDYFTMAGGMSLFPGGESQIIYLAPKVGILQKDNFDLAIGTLYFNMTSFDYDGVGLLYGVGTYGSENKAITFGAGWGYVAGEEVYNEPILMVGGELRISKSLKLLTENWIPPRSDVWMLTGGIRFFGKQLAADLGFMYPAGAETSGFPFMPLISFAYNFGAKK